MEDIPKCINYNNTKAEINYVQQRKNGTVHFFYINSIYIYLQIPGSVLRAQDTVVNKADKSLLS